MEKKNAKRIIDILLDYTDEKGEKPIVIAPPCLGDKHKLRVYAYGGEIGRIAGSHPRSCSTVLSSAYIKPEYLTNEEELKELNHLVNGNNGDSLLCMPRYMELASKAAEERFRDKERSIECDILKRYMKRMKRNWCVVDMEFFPSEGLDIGKGKPDLVVFDSSRNQFGVIELKFKNRSTENIEKHFTDFLELYINNERHHAFNREMKRRVNSLSEFNLVDDILANFDEKNPVWFGFLFVDGNKRKSKRIAETLKTISKWKDGEKICRFRYVEDVKGLEQNGLCFDSMENLEQFTSMR